VDPRKDYLSAPFGDTTVDNFQETSSGVIDDVPVLAFDIPDASLIRNLDQRISDSQEYWNKPNGFNLKQVRNDNMRLFLGKHIDQNKLYRYQTPYVENQIYIAENAIVSYLTAQNPSPEVYPSQNTQKSSIFAQDLEKAMKAHADMFQLAEIVGNVVRNALNKRLGVMKLTFDPLYGKNGEIVPKSINPEHIVVDKNARQGENPAFIVEFLKMSVNEVLSRWPEKKAAIYEELNIVRGTPKQLEAIVQVREAWFTYYDKQFKPQEGLAYYFGKVVLEKVKNPNYLYTQTKKNFFPMPPKPYLPLNFDNDGEHWVDYTGPIEQAAPMQDILNKRGRQLMEVVDKANGLTVFSSDSGLTKDDLQNLTGDPNQRVIIKTAGNSVADLVHRIDPPQIPNMLMQDKIDLRTQVHAVMSTPSEFTGVNDGGQDDPTLGQSEMKKNQASGRLDLYVRSVDRLMTRYFNLWVQFAVVWYDEDHFFVYNGGDGEFDYIVISRYLIEEGMIVSVKSGGTLPFDKTRQEKIALALAKMQLVSPLDVYKLMNLPNAQQLYDNWAKFKTAPMDLARDAMDEIDDNNGYVAYTKIMNGKDAELPPNVTKEYVLTLRKLMVNDEFIKAPRKYQTDFLKFVEKAVTSLEIKTSLDQVADSGNIEGLDPKNPIPSPQEQNPMQPPMPGAQPGLGGPPAPNPMPPSPLGGLPIPAGGAGALAPSQGMGIPGVPPSPLSGLPVGAPTTLPPM